MFLQLVGPIELSFATIALKQLKVQVSALMVLFVTFSDEPLIAELTLKRLISGVGPCMQDHQTLVFKGLIAVLKRTLDLVLLALVKLPALYVQIEVLLELLQLLRRLDSLVLHLVSDGVQSLVDLLHLIYWQIYGIGLNAVKLSQSFQAFPGAISLILIIVSLRVGGHAGVFNLVYPVVKLVDLQVGGSIGLG